MSRCHEPADAAARVSEAQLARLRGVLYQRTGLVFDARHDEFLRNRVFPRLAATGEPTFAGYLRRLDSALAPNELQTLINAVTVNETHFFREAYQLDCLTNSLLDEVVVGRALGSTVRVWSVPCSTGEEPYSLAMQLLERWPRVDDFDVEVLASDIDTRVLEVAREGLYGERSLREVSPALRERYFTHEGSSWRLAPEVRASVDFSRVNLTDPRETAAFHDVDVVFCRNLLIYFDDASRMAATEHLYRALRPGGFLCLGHSESMSRISQRFVPRRFPDALVFQKPRERR